MKQRVLLMSFLLFLVPMVKAQNYSQKFGKIGSEEIELKQYALDKDAEAVVLFDKAKSYFVERDGSFDVVFERETRVKLFSDAGIKWAEVEIPFYHESDIYEKVYDIEAYSYNFEDGRLTRTALELANTYDEKVNNYWNVKKFAIPNVKAGSVIEYRYSISSPYKFNFRDWNFQWKIPVVYSEYMVKMIPFYEYQFLLQGASHFDVKESYEDEDVAGYFPTATAYADNSYHALVHKYGMKNVPAFGDEEFISSINDYIIKLDFQLYKIHMLDGSTTEIITTWEDLIKELLKHPDFGKYIKRSEKLASKLKLEKVPAKTETEKFNAIVNYVKENYNWNKHCAKFASKSPNKFVEDKFGNCADLNLFTIGLLNAAGIEAYPLILSTRKHGRIYFNYPFSHFFNYVIILTHVDGKVILADATENLTRNNRIPLRCINNSKGLIIQKDKVDWFDLSCLALSRKITYMQMDIDENNVSVEMVKQGTEYDALEYRNNYTGNIEKIKQKLIANNYNIVDSSVVVQNQLDKTKPYLLKYKYSTKTEVVNNKIYVPPFLNEIIADNPLKQKERKYPVDMIYPRKRTFNSVLTIPDGYQVDFLPEEEKIKNEIFDLNYSIRKIENKLQVTFDYCFKRPQYQSSDYAKIKYFFHEIVKKRNERIVLTKKI